MPRIQHSLPKHCCVSLVIMITISIGTAASASQPTGPAHVDGSISSNAPEAVRPAPRAHGNEPFLLTKRTRFEADSRSSGGLFLDVMELPRPYQVVAQELREHPAGTTVTLNQCQGPQDDVIRCFEGVADRLAIFVFCKTDAPGPGPEEVVWPHVDSPIVNRVRQIPRLAKTMRVYGTVPLKEDTNNHIWGRDKQRPPSFEEVQFMAIAVIGADYSGIIWKGGFADFTEAARSTTFEAAIRKYADDLGRAEAVGWVSAPLGQPVTARFSGQKVFIMLLNPDYMNLGLDGVIVLPEHARSVEGDATVTLPQGLSVKACRYLMGGLIPLDTASGTVTVRYGFDGGGEMLIFDLEQDSPSATAGSLSNEATAAPVSTAGTTQP